MADLPVPQAVPQGYVKRCAHIQPIAKKWRDGKADKLKVEMVDLHAKLRDNWCALTAR